MKKKNDIPAYEKRIGELHAELEKAARTVGEKIGERDRLISENARLEEGNKVLEVKTDHRVKALTDLDSKISERSVQLSKITSEHNDRVIEHEVSIRELERQMSELGERISIAKMNLAALPNATAELANSRAELVKVTSAIAAQKREGDIINKETAKAMSALKEKEGQLRDLADRTGKVATQNVKDRYKIVVYAKRLQRYYNDHKIKLNILPVFEIKDIN